MSNHKVTEEIHEAVEIEDKKKTDSRGRVNLGTDYSDKEVKVAILEVE